jgi:hypothetical protein
LQQKPDTGSMIQSVVYEIVTDTCPRCDSPSIRKLEALGSFTKIDYFRCNVCWHVWSANRETGKKIQDVTPLKPEKIR